MKLYFPITVDLYNPHPLPRMNAQQHNVGRGAIITLTANGQVIVPDEETVRIFAKRPDKNVSYLDCSIVEEKIQADFTDQMLATEGNVEVELELATTETNITTPIFIVEVNKSNVKEGVESSNEYKALEKYTAEAKEAAEHAKEVYDNIPNYEANLIVSKASGEVITTTDSAKVKPKNIKLFGKSTQNGTPSKENEVAVESIGDSGSVVVTIEENGLSATIQTPNGLHGIPLGTTIPSEIANSPIHMSGVYWDSVEQQYYIADTKNEDGKDVQRIGVYTITGNEYWQKEPTGYGGSVPKAFVKKALFTHGIIGTEFVYASDQNNWFYWYCDDSEFPTLADWKNFIAGKTLYYVLPEPIITDTAEQYDVVMNYPNTTIVNDEGAYMEVEYVADAKCYIDNKFKELQDTMLEIQQAIVNS